MEYRNAYERDEYVIAKDLVNDEVLSGIETFIQDWTHFLIDQWISEGLLEQRIENLGLNASFLKHWQLAGKPQFRRAPFYHMFNKHIYRLLTCPNILDVVEQLLGTSEISVHGIFNTRFKFPGESWTTTPWHQDGQFYPAHGEPDPDRCYSANVLTVWIPLQDVAEKRGCMKVASYGQAGNTVPPLGDSPDKLFPQEISDSFEPKVLPMNRGDALFFNQKLPHASTGNDTDDLLWSIDVRFEATENQTISGQKYGFVARSKQDPNAISSYPAWCEKREKSAFY